MANTGSGANRKDPLGAYNFHVEIDGILVGGFMEVSGLNVNTDVETVKEGGVNSFEYKLPGRTSYTDIQLKHGVTISDSLYSWHSDVVKGDVQRKNATIHLLNSGGESVRSWNVYNAFPIKWQGPVFNAKESSVAVEVLVMAHEGIDKTA